MFLEKDNVWGILFVCGLEIVFSGKWQSSGKWISIPARIEGHRRGEV